jgi:hypothetical protein
MTGGTPYDETVLLEPETSVSAGEEAERSHRLRGEYGRSVFADRYTRIMHIQTYEEY